MHARLQENLAQVREAVAEAAKVSGRSADSVRLIAVTKYVNDDLTRALAEWGCLDLGESRPQQLWHKAEALADLPIRWHMIGHLQRNKARRTVPLLSVLHSGDSQRLLETAAAEWPGPERLPVLLEVNVSGDTAKHGFAPAEMESALEDAARFHQLQVIGLMGMGSLQGGRDQAQRDFAALRELRDKLRGNCPPEASLDELSMGMSDDYDVAIREGATMVRVGSTLFEGVDGGS